MPTDTKVTIYYGPLPWFAADLAGKRRKGLLEVVYERDEANRRFTHTVEGQLDAPSPVRRLKRVAAESGDYASLNEHVITNFDGFVRALNPKYIYLHNPPASIHAQLERSFPSTKVKRYTYPKVTVETLTQFRDRFSAHLVGQADVREALLAALYPLTTSRRQKPVVLLFYGPSGVGKTEAAHLVNDLLGGVLMRKQFSMFHNDKFASYLFGGTHSEASFARDLLDRESGVILIDEFDKANEVFHSAFYQLFDNGVFEDKNYRVELGSSLVVCTSNYGSEGEIRDALGDALYSRFDALVRFEHLSPAEIKLVVKRLAERHYANLETREQEVLDLDGILRMLQARAVEVGNVRKLGKLVEQVFSMMLIDVLLPAEKGTLGASRDGDA